MSWTIRRADLRLLEVIRDLPDNHYDAIECDPPYALTDGRALTWDEIEVGRSGGGFMGSKWDSAIPGPTFWRECLRVLKPGAPLVAFGGSRTYHRLACAIEDAGFELRDEISDFVSTSELAQRFLDSLDPEQRAAFDEAFRGSPYAHWIYAQGFPKSLDNERAVSCATCSLPGRHFASTLPRPAQRKPDDHLCPTTMLGERFEGGGTALKPAHEPIVLARKPVEGTIAENLLKWGVGGLAIDACRVATDWSDRSEAWKRSGHSAKPDAEKIAAPAGNGIECHEDGRWPANVVFEHTDRCVSRGTKRVRGSAPIGPSPGARRGEGFGHKGGRGTQAHDYVDDDGLETAEAFDCAEDCPVRALDEQAGTRTSGAMRAGTPRPIARLVFGATSGAATDDAIEASSGAASRFFFCPKADRIERDLGCEALPLRSAAEVTCSEEGQARLDSPRTGAGRTSGARNHHPTVKKIETCQWLATMVLPPSRADGMPRRLLVPFAGSGSEMIGGLRAGFEQVDGLELEEPYIDIAKARLARWESVPASMTVKEALASASSSRADERQVDLFGSAKRASS